MPYDSGDRITGDGLYGEIEVERCDETTFRVKHDRGPFESMSAHLILVTKLLERELELDLEDEHADEQLAERVDPDCLEDVFRSIKWRAPRDQGHIQFPFRGFDVRLGADDTITLTVRE